MTLASLLPALGGLTGGLTGGGGAGVPFSGSDSSSGDLGTGVTIGGISVPALRPKDWTEAAVPLILAAAVLLYVVKQYRRA